MNEAEKLINSLYGKGTIGFTCDSCGRELNSCSVVNGMKFCAKCYQETFGKDNQQEEIKQLIQQLEQVQTRIKELEDKDWYESNIKQLEEQNDRLIQERDNLKQQLEEKGQEINIKNNKLAELKKELTICKDKLKRKTQSNRDLQHRVHNVNTQLAIQELEKVKNFVDGRTYCADYINKRIQELKGE